MDFLSTIKGYWFKGMTKYYENWLFIESKTFHRLRFFSQCNFSKRKRLAAAACRHRKKERIQKMQNDVILLLEENKQIRHENELLRKFFYCRQMSFKGTSVV